MKRLPAILFLLILVFNFYGYRMVISYMDLNGSAAMEKKLDQKEYSDSELISVKTTLNLPYYTSSPTFERAYGSINIKGVVYEYVKKRVYKDTLELLCLPNTIKTKLHAVKNELAKSAADSHASLPVKKGSTTLKLSLPDFFQPVESFSAFTIKMQRNYLLQNERFHISSFGQQPERPPQKSSFVS